MNMNKVFSKLLAATAGAVMFLGTPTADAGRGGSNSDIKSAIRSGSSIAIIAELERAEYLMCYACIDTVMPLLDDARFEVREAAAWWFSRRPAREAEVRDVAIANVYGSDAVLARNAADLLGALNNPSVIADLEQLVRRTDLGPEPRAHAVMALGEIGHKNGVRALQFALSDNDATVRLQATTAWLRIRGHATAADVAPLVSDADLMVRRKAAAVVGEKREHAGRVALEAQLLEDADPAVRRNAAWALGQIGDAASRAALTQAESDASGLVRMTATLAKRNLR